MTPGRKPSINASALAASLRTTSRPAGAFTSSARERRPRCSTSNFGSRPGNPRSAASWRSRRITSAPMSANSVAANGAGPIPAISMMRNPARGPIMVTFPLRLHAIAAPHWLPPRRNVAFLNSTMLACPTQASTRNGRAPSVSPLRDLPGRLRTWLRAGAEARLEGAATSGVRARANARVRALHPHRRAWLGLLRRSRTFGGRCENEARYRDLLDNQADVILRRDGEGRLTFVNQALCRTFGLDRTRVLGNALKPHVLAGDAAAPFSPSCDRRHQRYVKQIETAGSPRWFEWEEQAVVAGDAAIREGAVLRDAISRSGGAPKPIGEGRETRRRRPPGRRRCLAAGMDD